MSKAIPEFTSHIPAQDRATPPTGTASPQSGQAIVASPVVNLALPQARLAPASGTLLSASAPVIKGDIALNEAMANLSLSSPGKAPEMKNTEIQAPGAASPPTPGIDADNWGNRRQSSPPPSIQKPANENPESRTSKRLREALDIRLKKMQLHQRLPFLRQACFEGTYNKIQDRAHVIKRMLAIDEHALETQDLNGAPMLVESILRGRPELTALLLEHGAQVDNAGDMGFSALFFSCERGNHDQIRRLVQAGADINRVNASGLLPIMPALNNGDVETVDLLLTLGARLDLPIRDFHPLRDARADGLVELAACLEKHGCKH